MSTVSIHPTMKKTVDDDKCPKCGGELDTGWECNDCGYDAAWVAHHDAQIPRHVYWWPGQE